MATTTSALDRSAESLKRLFAFIVTLALAEALRRSLIDPSTQAFGIQWQRLPAFATLVLLIVPFYQGMHRHLDAMYVESSEKPPARAALFFDFWLFLIESATLFALALMIADATAFFATALTLLLVDAVWCTVSSLIHGKGSANARKWCIINLACAAIGAIICLSSVFPDRAPVLAILFAARLTIDYAWCWDFYFPNTVVSATK